MAEKRMFARSVICTDRFRKMSPEAQGLYLQLSMDADDDGIVGSAVGICRACGAHEDTLGELERNGYLLRTDGAFVIAHWQVHNSIRQDRKQASLYPAVLAQLRVDGGGVYILADKSDLCLPHERGVHVRTEKGREEEKREDPSPHRAPARGKTETVILTEDERKRLGVLMGEGIRDGYIEHLADYMRETGKRYDSHYTVILRWWKEDRRKGRTPKTKKQGSFDTDEFFEAALKRSYGYVPQGGGQ